MIVHPSERPEVHQTPPDLRESPKAGVVQSRLALAGIVALAAALRFARLGHHSLWFDEAWVAWMVGHRWEDLLSLLRTSEGHPPLYYLLMKAWTGVAGMSEAALRVPSACFSVVSVALVYLLAHRVAAEPVSLLSALLAAVSPFAIVAGQEARMYPLLGMLAVGSTYALARAVERGSALRWTAYTALTALLLYTHYLGVLVVLAHGLWVAGWARRSLQGWLWAMGAVTVLYAPWLPAFRDQIAYTHRMYEVGRFLRAPGTRFDLMAVLGLLAFGGSYLGFPSYLSGGPGETAVQILILLPFLFVLWRGVASLMTSPRELALVGLPPGVVLGVMIAASMGKLTAVPRWFSFLVPFYAIIVAWGVFDVAERIRWRRGLTAALVTAGLVLYSLPVLNHYYFDPRSRLYQWRTAAAVVKTHMRSSDAFLYVGWEPAIALRYYMPEAHPSLILMPVEMFGDSGRSGAFGGDQARQLAARFPRAWLILTTPVNPTHPYMQRRLFPALASGFRTTGGWEFGGIWVYLLEAKSAHSS